MAKIYLLPIHRLGHQSSEWVSAIPDQFSPHIRLRDRKHHAKRPSIKLQPYDLKICDRQPVCFFQS